MGDVFCLDYCFEFLKGTGDGSVGGFWWSLHFNWITIPQRTRNAQKTKIDPYPCVYFLVAFVVKNLHGIKISCCLYLDHRPWLAVF